MSPVPKSIHPEDLGIVLRDELQLYHKETIDDVNAAGERAAKKLVKLTKKTAPKKTGNYRKSLTFVTKENRATGDKEFIWGAKAPHHRLTHLLVKGHPTGNGGRTKGDPFLENAIETILPEYEREVEEALKK